MGLCGSKPSKKIKQKIESSFQQRKNETENNLNNLNQIVKKTDQRIRKLSDVRESLIDLKGVYRQQGKRRYVSDCNLRLSKVKDSLDEFKNLRSSIIENRSKSKNLIHSDRYKSHYIWISFFDLIFSNLSGASILLEKEIKDYNRKEENLKEMFETAVHNESVN